MNKHFVQVVEFMKTFGQKVPSAVTVPSTQVALLRHELIREELEDELVPALERDDIVEIADALTDILYVAHGAHAAFGTKPKLDDEWIVAPKDMRTIGAPSVQEAYAAIKSMRTALEEMHMCYQNVHMSSDAFMKALAMNLDIILNTSYKLAWQSGIDIFRCFEEVHASNMSKVCKTRTEAENSIQWRIETANTSTVVENYTGATVHEVNGFFVIKRAADGKALKGRNYFEPKLKDILFAGNNA